MGQISQLPEGIGGCWGRSSQPQRMGDWSGGKTPIRQMQVGLETKPPAMRDFYNFSIKLTHFYAHFCQSSYFKAITHQSKAFKKQSKRTKYGK